MWWFKVTSAVFDNSLMWVNQFRNLCLLLNLLYNHSLSQHLHWPSSILVLSVSILAENDEIKHLLQSHGIDSETLEDVHPIRVQPSRVLSHIYARLGELRAEETSQTKLKTLSSSCPFTPLWKKEVHMTSLTPQYSEMSDHNTPKKKKKRKMNFLK